MKIHQERIRATISGREYDLAQRGGAGEFRVPPERREDWGTNMIESGNRTAVRKEHPRISSSRMRRSKVGEFDDFGYGSDVLGEKTD